MGHLKTHARLYIYICIYIYICLCVCIYMYRYTPFVSIPRSPKGPGEPYSSSLIRITPTCLDPQGPHRVPGALHWGFLCSPGAPRGQGNPTRHHLFVSPPPVSIPRGPQGSRGPTLGISLFPRGPIGPRGERPGPCHKEAQRLKQTSPSKYGAS